MSENMFACTGARILKFMLFVRRPHLQFSVSGRLFFSQVVVTGVDRSDFTAHSKVTSLPRMTFRFRGLLTNSVGSEHRGEHLFVPPF